MANEPTGMGLSADLEAFVGEVELLDGEVVALRVEARDGDLGRPRVAKGPGHRGLVAVAGLVQELDGDRSRGRKSAAAVTNFLSPIPERRRSRDSALQRDVGVLLDTGKLAGR